MSSSPEAYAVIENGIVVNTIMWNGDANPETGGIAPPQGQTWALINGQFVTEGYLVKENSDGTYEFIPPE